jgi:hypothetical protein
LEGTGRKKEVEKKGGIRIYSSFKRGFRRSHIMNVKRRCRDLAGERLKAKKKRILKWVISNN